MSAARDRIDINRDVLVKPAHTGLDVSFRYMTPGKAKVANFLFRVIQLPIYICFVIDVVLAYAWAAGDARSVIPFDLGFFNGVYDIYSYFGQIVADLVFALVIDAPARSRFADGLTLVGSGFVVTLVIPGIFRGLERRDLAPRILSPLFASRGRVSVSPRQVRIGRKAFSYNADDKFIAGPTRATRTRRHPGPEDEQSREIVFVQGVTSTPVATVYGADKAGNITTALGYCHDNIRPLTTPA